MTYTMKTVEKEGFVMKNIFLVWVGGVADEFDSEEEAKLAEAEWIAQGYDDVQVEIIQQVN